MSNILWHSNAPWTPSGYGNQTKLFIPELRRLGHDVACSAFWGLRGGQLTLGDYEVYPGYIDQVGNDVFETHCAKAFGGNPRNGILITLFDVWPFIPSELKKVNWAPWVPVDHEPVPKRVREVLKEGNAVPIAMSRFGEHQLKEAGFDPLYVPHAVDTSVFKPTNNKAEARKAVGFPEEVTEDTFIIGMVAANQGNNPPRKSWPQVFEAFSKFVQIHPDSILYCHTFVGDEKLGVDLSSLAWTLKIPERKLIFCDQKQLVYGYSMEHMVNTYNAMDVFCNPSYGEGFGIPILEAQACGIPAIVTNFSAMPQVCGSGWAVEGELWWTSQKAFQVMPRADKILEAMENAYVSARKPHMKQAARSHALSMDLHTVTDTYWKPALDTLAFIFGNVELVPA